MLAERDLSPNEQGDIILVSNVKGDSLLRVSDSCNWRARHGLEPLPDPIKPTKKSVIKGAFPKSKAKGKSKAAKTKKGKGKVVSAPDIIDSDLDADGDEDAIEEDLFGSVEPNATDPSCSSGVPHLSPVQPSCSSDPFDSSRLDSIPAMDGIITARRSELEQIITQEFTLNNKIITMVDAFNICLSRELESLSSSLP